MKTTLISGERTPLSCYRRPSGWFKPPDSSTKTGLICARGIPGETPRAARQATKRTPLRRELPRQAFTLIELLVTIAVIAILASLSLTALSMAKTKANSAKCLNNLRQLGIAVRLCADDNEGRLPSPQATSRPTDSPPITLNPIEEVLARYVSRDRKVFRCPAHEKENPSLQTYSYEWNSSLNGRMLHNIEAPAQNFLLRDLEPWHPKRTRNAVFADGHGGAEE